MISPPACGAGAGPRRLPSSTRQSMQPPCAARARPRRLSALRSRTIWTGMTQAEVALGRYPQTKILAKVERENSSAVVAGGHCLFGSQDLLRVDAVAPNEEERMTNQLKPPNPRCHAGEPWL